MSCQPSPSTLSDEQKAQIYGILSVGCDRQTAADFIGCSLADIRLAMQLDPVFLAGVLRAEASVELSHMRNVQEVAKEKKDWRASVWWLESRSPERFARRSGAVTVRQLNAFVQILIDTVNCEVTNPDDRQRFEMRMRQIAESAEQMLRDAQANATEITTTAADSVEMADKGGSEKFLAAGLIGPDED